MFLANPLDADHALTVLPSLKGRVYAREMKKTIYGSRIKEARAALRLSQEELGARAGVSQRAISSYEHGVSEPSLETWQRLAFALGKPAAYLAGFEHETGLDPREEGLLEIFRKLDSSGQDLMYRLAEAQSPLTSVNRKKAG